MSCTRVYDFISGVAVSLNLEPREDRDGPVLDIVRPNPTAADVLRQHERVLLEQARRAA